tara:strand:+ start:1140 stop:1568 length:429 start_codon:yes stop_codon:yes gene_type:complete
MEATPIIYATESVHNVFNDSDLLRKILYFAGSKPGSNKSGKNRCIGENVNGKRCACKVSNNELLCFTHKKKFYKERVYYLDVFYISKETNTSPEKQKIFLGKKYRKTRNRIDPRFYLDRELFNNDDEYFRCLHNNTNAIVYY